MKLKKTILFVTILILLVGTVYASETSDETKIDESTDTIDTTSTDNSIETNEIIKEEKILTETKEIKKE